VTVTGRSDHHGTLAGQAAAGDGEEFKELISTLTVAALMSRDVVTVESTTSVEALADLLLTRGIEAVPVVDAGRLVGMVTKGDVLRALLGRTPGPPEEDAGMCWLADAMGGGRERLE
jgi:predicted transcriptional regulator